MGNTFGQFNILLAHVSLTKFLGVNKDADLKPVF